MDLQLDSGAMGSADSNVTENNPALSVIDDADEDEEKKSEIEELVACLQNPQQCLDPGAYMPKGAVVAGPPGTVKDLLAKATAGEANVTCITVTSYEFYEMLTGDAPKRVRNMFASARQKAPCILFVDENEPVGSTQSQRNGANEEDAILNQLLIEMDAKSKENNLDEAESTESNGRDKREEQKQNQRKRKLNSPAVSEPEVKVLVLADDVTCQPKTSLLGVSGSPSLDSKNYQLPAPGQETLDLTLYCNSLDRPEIRYLATMDRVLFLDLENVQFFKVYEGPVPSNTFFWGFMANRPGKNIVLKTTLNLPLYRSLKSQNLVHISTEIGTSKDAADFALCVTLCKLDDRLPKSIGFYILSGDKGFIEVQNQLMCTGRNIKVITAKRKEKLNSSLFL